jgi:Ser/Thr protein kinase RdoA (MazF antagonist)
MDDRFIYLLNGLIAREYSLGRIARFRHIKRGRQAQAVELLTAEGREFVAWLYPQAFTPDRFTQLAPIAAAMADEHFPIARLVPTHPARYAAEGPQSQALVITEATPGVPLPREEWTAQMLSLVGLRLAWLHRLLSAQPASATDDQLSQRFAKACATPTARTPSLPPQIKASLTEASATVDNLFQVHRDISADSVLLDGERQMRSIVDWGLLAPGCAEEDLLNVFQQWCVQADGTVRSDELRAFLEAYRTLCPLPLDPAERWTQTAARWLAATYVDAADGTRALPRGWMTMAREPRAIADALLLCEPK